MQDRFWIRCGPWYWARPGVFTQQREHALSVEHRESLVATEAMQRAQADAEAWGFRERPYWARFRPHRCAVEYAPADVAWHVRTQLGTTLGRFYNPREARDFAARCNGEA